MTAQTYAKGGRGGQAAAGMAAVAAHTGSTAAGMVGIAAGTSSMAVGIMAGTSSTPVSITAVGHHGDHKHHRGGHHRHHRNYGWLGPAFYGYGYGYGYPYYYYYGPYPYYGAYPTVYRRYVVTDYYALVVSVQKARPDAVITAARSMASLAKALAAPFLLIAPTRPSRHQPHRQRVAQGTRLGPTPH